MMQFSDPRVTNFVQNLGWILDVRVKKVFLKYNRQITWQANLHIHYMAKSLWTPEHHTSMSLEGILFLKQSYPPWPLPQPIQPSSYNSLYTPGRAFYKIVPF